METRLLNWANLLLRWAHVVTAIVWVGYAELRPTMAQRCYARLD